MEITKELWGKTPQGREIFRYTLTNSKGAFVRLCDVGAGIVSIVVPDTDGKLADVVIGYNDPMDYFADGPCSGKIPGRYANRIALGHFTLDGKEYTLPVNNGPNHLHGGPEGFQNQVWESRIDGEAVEFLYRAEDGEMGYPGAVDVVARYEWSEDNCLTLTLSGKSDAPTLLNLTNHVYFNLKGAGNGKNNHHFKASKHCRRKTKDTSLAVITKMNTEAYYITGSNYAGNVAQKISQTYKKFIFSGSGGWNPGWNFSYKAKNQA